MKWSACFLLAFGIMVVQASLMPRVNQDLLALSRRVTHV